MGCREVDQWLQVGLRKAQHQQNSRPRADSAGKGPHIATFAHELHLETRLREASVGALVKYLEGSPAVGELCGVQSIRRADGRDHERSAVREAGRWRAGRVGIERVGGEGDVLRREGQCK